MARRTAPAPGQLDLFADAAPATPAAPHQFTIGWEKNPDRAAWQAGPGGPPHLLYRATCGQACGWSTSGHGRENSAVEAALDHAWPGWRNLPAVPAKPNESDPARWLAAVVAVYPPGWVEAGGPVRTIRGAPGNRHHFDAALDFWDLGVPA